jgi:hypothetical protein
MLAEAKSSDSLSQSPYNPRMRQHHHRLVRRGPVIDVYVDGKLTSLQLEVVKIDEVRGFMQGVPEAEIDRKMQQLLGPNGETEFVTTET